MRHLTWNEKSLHQLTLAAGNQAGETLEPLAFGNFGVGVQPRGKGKDVVPRNLPFSRTSK